MAVKDIIGPGFVGTATIKWIPTRGLLGAPVNPVAVRATVQLRQRSATVALRQRSATVQLRTRSATVELKGQ